MITVYDKDQAVVGQIEKPGDIGTVAPEGVAVDTLQYDWAELQAWYTEQAKATCAEALVRYEFVAFDQVVTYAMLPLHLRHAQAHRCLLEICNAFDRVPQEKFDNAV